MKKAKTHVVLMRVTFDKPVGRADALTEIRDNIHGTVYTTGFSEAGEFKVNSFKSPPAGVIKPRKPRSY